VRLSLHSAPGKSVLVASWLAISAFAQRAEDPSAAGLLRASAALGRYNVGFYRPVAQRGGVSIELFGADFAFQGTVDVTSLEEGGAHTGYRMDVQLASGSHETLTARKAASDSEIRISATAPDGDHELVLYLGKQGKAPGLRRVIQIDAVDSDGRRSLPTPQGASRRQFAIAREAISSEAEKLFGAEGLAVGRAALAEDGVLSTLSGGASKTDQPTQESGPRAKENPRVAGGCTLQCSTCICTWIGVIPFYMLEYCTPLTPDPYNQNQPCDCPACYGVWIIDSCTMILPCYVLCTDFPQPQPA
jgi:hypothetical protein